MSPSCYDGKIVRPLLYTSKQEIIDYAQKHNLPFVIDSTNNNLDLTRNYIRNTLSPNIKKIFPAYESVTVTETKMKTYYTEDGSIYVDVNEAGDDVAMLCIYNNGKPTYYAVSKTEKDENGVLTVTVSDGTVYKVEIKDGKAVVTKVETEN